MALISSHTTPSSIVFGCTVAVFSSAIQSLGITLQRKSHLIHIQPSGISTNGHQHHHHHQRYKRNMWLFGFLMFIVANVVGSLIQISTLPLIILSPLQSIGLIFNSMFSCILLTNERATYKLIIGTCIIAMGAFIIAHNGNTESPSPPATDPKSRFNLVMEKLLRRSFMGWFVTTFVFIGILLVANYILLRRRKKLEDKLQRRRNRNHNKAINQLQFVRGINYGIISGTLTAHTFLFAKSLVDVIIETILSGNHGFTQIFTFSNFTPYFLLLMMLTIIGFQLSAFNLGLAEISTSILYPLCFLVYNLMNLINDLLFNSLIKDKLMTIPQLSWIVIGLSDVLIGVVMLSWDSAFGNTHEAVGEMSEDDLIFHLKFPYNQDQGEISPLVPVDSGRSYGSNTSQYKYFGEHLSEIEPSGSPLNPKKRSRVLSYEESQLMNSIDI